MISSDEFAQFCKVAREHNVKTLKLGPAHEVIIEFNKEEQRFMQTTDRLPIAEGMPTEDQMLLWSTNYMPDHKKGDS